MDRAIKIHEETGKKLGTVLVENGMVDEKQIMEILEFQLGIPFIDIDNIKIDPEVQNIVPLQLIRKHNVVPVKQEMGLL